MQGTEAMNGSDRPWHDGGGDGDGDGDGGDGDGDFIHGAALTYQFCVLSDYSSMIGLQTATMENSA